MYAIQQNSCKTLQLRRNRHHCCAAQTHENVMIERQASEIFCSIRRSEICCDSRHLYESNWTLRSSVISNKIYETRTDDWRVPVISSCFVWINPRVPSLGVDTERDFHPVVSSFHQTYEADKIRFLYLSTERALIHTQGTWM